MKKGLILLTALVAMKVWAKPANPDLVVPVGNAQDDLVQPNPKADAQQDAIQRNLIRKEDIDADRAQNRTPPRREKNHVYLVPSVEDAGQLSATTKDQDHKTKPSSGFLSFHGGPYNPTNLGSDVPGLNYADVYGKNATALIQFDYEWDFLRAVGMLGFKAGLGFFTAQGDGRFVHRPDIQSDETLALFAFPVTAALAYHMQYWDRQLFVPYGEAGIDYFGMMEVNTLATSISGVKVGGGAAAHYAAGVGIQLDALSRSLRWTLEHEYGMNHMYLNLGIRQFFKVSSVYDFSAFMFEGGVGLEF